MITKTTVHKFLSDAVASATPSCSQMFTNLPECSSKTRSDKTNPSPPATRVTALAASAAPRSASTDATAPEPRGCSQIFTDLHTCSPIQRNDETNPPQRSSPHLTARQVAVARLLALGRSGSAAAREVGVEKHTITRWKRSPGFADEVHRQHDLILAEQVRQRRAEKVDAFAAVADRVARKYGMVR
jgi:hypothetical protein